jgi:hypothetical protein
MLCKYFTPKHAVRTIVGQDHTVPALYKMMRSGQCRESIKPESSWVKPDHDFSSSQYQLVPKTKGGLSGKGCVPALFHTDSRQRGSHDVTGVLQMGRKGRLGERLCGLPFSSFPTTRACGLEYDSDSELVSNLG